MRGTFPLQFRPLLTELELVPQGQRSRMHSKYKLYRASGKGWACSLLFQDFLFDSLLASRGSNRLRVHLLGSHCASTALFRGFGDGKLC